MEFRRASVKLDQQGTISDLRILSLGHIFYFAEDQRDSVSKNFLTVAEHDQLYRSITLPLEKLPDEARQWATKLQALATSCDISTTFALKTHTASFMKDAIDQQSEKLLDFADIMHRLFWGTWKVFKKSSKALQLIAPRLRKQLNSNVEDTFLKDRFADIMDVMFSEERALDHDWANKGLPSFVKIDEDIKVDYLVQVTPKERQVPILVMEAKAPTKVSRKKEGSSDFVKLGKELKCVCDNLVTLGIGKPRAAGILVKGK